MAGISLTSTQTEKEPEPRIDVRGTINNVINATGVLELKSRYGPLVLDLLHKSKILELERYIQGKILGRPKVVAVVDTIHEIVKEPEPIRDGRMESQASKQPIDVCGFFKVSAEKEATFFVTTSWPGFDLEDGWSAIGIVGIIGRIRVYGSSDKPGTEPVSSLVSEPYNWSFKMQSDTEQVIEGVQYSIGAFLYPPGKEQYPSQQRLGPVYGWYEIVSHVPRLYFTTPAPAGTRSGWYVIGLPTLGVSEIIEYDENIATGVGRLSGESGAATSVSRAILKPIDLDEIPENSSAPIYVRGAPAMIIEPKFTQEFIPQLLISSNLELRGPITINSNVIGGSFTQHLRDLNTGIDDAKQHEEKYIEIKNRGFSAGSVLSLFAVGPQDSFLSSNNYSSSPWTKSFKQHTNFVMYQRVIPFPPPNPTYHDKTIQIELLPTELGHLISNMYFKCTINQASSNGFVNENIGRALIKQVEILVNETVVETLYDDWYILRDQLFLDADEQLGMFSVVGGLNAGIVPNTNLDIVCPLEFFFCRRQTHQNKERDRLRKPYFPLCAMWNQKLYVRFTFHHKAWWCSNVASDFDISNPKLITEEILLENAEKLYYQNTPLKYIVNQVKKESTLSFSGGNPQLQLTANFPIQSIFWFFRNKNYESIRVNDAISGVYYDSRYNYGYTTDFIQTGVSLKFPSSNLVAAPYVDVIDTAKITLNNVDILSTFQGSLYYSFKQPLEHRLSIPSRNIYTYSFGLNPTEYSQGGILDFSKLNSHTTTLTLAFNASYSQQISQGYNLYLFYYGYTILEFQNGFARLPFS
jgi:hypothetical protein